MTINNECRNTESIYSLFAFKSDYEHREMLEEMQNFDDFASILRTEYVYWDLIALSFDYRLLERYAVSNASDYAECYFQNAAIIPIPLNAQAALFSDIGAATIYEIRYTMTEETNRVTIREMFSNLSPESQEDGAFPEIVAGLMLFRREPSWRRENGIIERHFIGLFSNCQEANRFLHDHAEEYAKDDCMFAIVEQYSTKDVHPGFGDNAYQFYTLCQEGAERIEPTEKELKSKYGLIEDEIYRDLFGWYRIDGNNGIDIG